MNFDFGVDHEWCYTEKCKKVTTTRSAIVDATLAAERFQKFVSHGLYYAQIQRLQSLEFPFYFNFRCFFLKILFILRENERDRAREGGGSEGEAEPALIRGLQDHGLSRRQSINQLSHPGAQFFFFF